MKTVKKPKITFKSLDFENSEKREDSENRITQAYNHLFAKAYMNIVNRRNNANK